MRQVLLIGGARAGEIVELTAEADTIRLPAGDEGAGFSSFGPMETAEYVVCPFQWHGATLHCAVPYDWGYPDQWDDTLRTRIEDSIMAVTPVPDERPQEN